MRKLTIATATLLLAACQQPAAPDNAVPVDADNTLAMNDATVVPADEAPVGEPAPADTAPSAPESAPTTTPTPSPSATASPKPADLAAFPPRFRGRWGLTVADCDPKRADNKGLMRIEAMMVRFYESRGTASSLDRRKPGTIVAKLAMNGEGQTWVDTSRFTLREDGKILVRASDQGGGPLRYTKCTG